MAEDINDIVRLAEVRAEWRANYSVKNDIWPLRDPAEVLQEEDQIFNEHFDNWYTGNHNPETNKITLYRSIQLSLGDIDAIKTKGLFPSAFRDGKRIRSLDEVTALLKEKGKTEELNDLETWISGDRRGISCDCSGTAGHDQYSVRQCFRTSPEGFGSGWTRITVELDIDEAIRDEDFFPPEFEWNVIGPIDPSKIVEIREVSKLPQMDKDVLIYRRPENSGMEAVNA
ncbi:hypothetical protein HOD83_03440 [Candidatus Woesearchaeota archaeon]|jgi:hypothetical protein|nr:hypothetical protein [Candidatus Woesearchaeota archaeon]MBT4114064.1 hypothetical protein [Candidatus Woesearchaeota archaeon]MBT4248608.1 hypothetical protein [Candidatus Woesearchaeota archaeon]